MTLQKNAEPLVEKPVFGRILFFSIVEAYGWAVADTGEQVYVPHVSIVWDGELNCDHEHGICGRRFERGDRVQFRIFESELGLEARNVKRVQDDGRLVLPPLTFTQRRYYEAQHQKRFPETFTPRSIRERTPR